MKIIDDTFPTDKLSVMTGQQAKSLYSPETDYNVDLTSSDIAVAALSESVQMAKNIPTGLEIMWGQSKMVLGDMVGSESIIKSGQSNIQTANRNYEQLKDEYELSALQLTPEERDSWNFLLTSAGSQYGTQLALALIPGVGTTTSLGYMGALSASSTAIQGLEQYKEEDPDDVNFEGFKDVAGKELGLNVVKTGVNLLVEKFWGVTGQLGAIRKAGEKAVSGAFKAGLQQTLKQAGKGAAKGYAMELGTEMSQSITDAGFDYLLDRYKSGDEVAQAITGSIKGAVAAAVFGGVAGGSGAVYYRGKAISDIKDVLKDTVPEQDLNNVATAIVDKGINTLKGAMDVELELSSQLKSKHGAVYDSMVKAVKQTMDNSGAFTDMTEIEQAEYISDTSKMFADQVLAEANKRKSLIDDVIKSSDIRYEDGKLRLAPLKEGESKTFGQQEFLFQSDTYKEGKADITTPEFKNWFGDSKVVDESGQPKVMYHGTNANFDVFKDMGYRKKGNAKGFYFSDNRNSAEIYSSQRDGGSFIMEVYLDMKNPIYVYNYKDIASIDSSKIKELKNKGYDGIIYKDRGEFGDTKNMMNEYVVFTPNQIKSVYNKGTFSEDSDNIYYQKEGFLETDINTESFKEWSNDNTVYQMEEARQHNFTTGEPVVVRADHGGMKDIEILSEDYAGETTGNNEWGAYFFSGSTAIAEDYSKQSFIRFYDGRSKEELMEDYNLSEQDVDAIIEDIEGYAEERLQTNPSYIRFDNPYVIDMRGEGQDVEAIQDLIGFIKNNEYSESRFVEELRENISYSQDDINYYMDEIKERAIENNGLEEEAEIEDYMIQDATNEVLEENGIYPDIPEYDGIIVQNVVDDISPDSAFVDNVYIALSPNQVKSVFNQGNWSKYNDNRYFQKKGTYKGHYDANSKAIEITKNADTSTLPHELAHYWLDNMLTYDASGAASPEYKAQLQVIKDFIGWRDGMTRSQKTKAHEKFARGYEKYILKGNIPNSLMGNTFDEYDKWLKRVYNKANQLKVKLSDDAIRFFDSMTTGELITAETNQVIKEQAKKERQIREVEESIKESEKFIEERAEVIEENKIDMPISTTDYGTSYLRSVVKTTGAEIEAGTVNLETEMARAEEFVKNNPEKAQRIVQGLENEPDGMLKNTIYLAYDKFQKELGNTDARAEALINQGLELRRAGQEISSQRLAYKEGAVNTPQFWASEVVSNRTELLANKNGLTMDELNKKIGKKTQEIVNNLPSENADVFIESKIKELTDELGVLYQKDVDFKLKKTYDTKASAYNEVYRLLNAQLKTGLSQQEATEIARIADDMLASLDKSIDKTGNPSIAYFEKLQKMEDYTNSLAPSPELRVLTSVIMRGNLLASIKSPFLNIQSNALFGGIRAIARRITNQTYENNVDKKAVDEYKAYSYDLFKRTGYNISTMNAENIGSSSTLGEKITHSEGEGVIRRIGRFYQNTVYKWGLGWGDLIAKDINFVDYATLEATKRAKEAGVSATELFKDVILLSPKTEIGAEIRERAIEEALIATYQDNSAISQASLKVRGGLDKAIGNKGFAEAILPFVKTPANVINQSLKSGFGLVEATARYTITSIKQGKLADPDKKTVEALVTGGMGLMLATAIASGIDEDDYMPPYSIASAKDKQLARQLNIPFNAVKFGDTWYSLDYLSVLGVPIAGVLNAKREEGVVNKIYSYIKSGLIQAANLPFIGGISDIEKAIETGLRKEGEDIAKDFSKGSMEFLYNRSVPAIVSDMAKVLDKEERERTIVSTQVPFARETAPLKYSYASGEAISRGDNFVARALRDLLFGARVKVEVESKISDELIRLNNVGQGVSLSTVTKYGDLKELSDERKERVEETFAKQYANGVAKLIRTTTYKRKSDEDKKKAINKIRDNIREDLKKKYLRKKKIKL